MNEVITDSAGSPASDASSPPLLQVVDLKVYFPVRGQGLFRRRQGWVRAVDGVSFQVQPGETLGLVGESGCGKSTLGFSILRLLRPPGIIASGQIRYHDNDIVKMNEKELLSIRGNRIGMIFQDPLTSLNPLFRVGDQFVETIQTHEKTCFQKTGPGTIRGDAQSPGNCTG